MERYQTIGKRFLASLVDGLVTIPVAAAAVFVELAELPIWIKFTSSMALGLAGLGYNILMHWQYGQTLGKMAAGVKVLDMSDGPMTFWQSCIRNVVYIVINCVQNAIVFYLLLAGYIWRSEPVTFVHTYAVFPIYLWLFIDTIVCIKNKKNRALHDLIAGTVVVRLDVPAEVEDGQLFRFEPPRPDVYDFSSGETEDQK